MKLAVVGCAYRIVVAALTLLFGLALVVGGVQLLQLGGSPYYLIAGLVASLVAVLLLLRSLWAAPVYAVLLLATLGWSLWEAGSAFWPLAARLGLPAVLGLLIAFAVPMLKGGERFRTSSRLVGGVFAVGLIGAFALAFQPIWTVRAAGEPAPVANPLPMPEAADWLQYGRTPEGDQFAPFDQITPANVAQLKVAWTFRTGDLATGGKENQNTPLQIGDRLFACTPSNQVFALDAETGRQVWKYDPQVGAGASPSWQRCRSVAYHDLAPTPRPSPQGAGWGEAAACERRLYLTTADMRLIAIDAANGQPCAAFGQNGVVALATGMGPVIPGFYNPTSGPVVAGDNLIVGGWVMDNQSTDEPSGVVRAFDLRTGALAWAYDVGRPGQPNPPPEGQTYTRGTPNMWSVPTYDAALGLVFLPMGNGTPDMYGGRRIAATDRVGAAIVALDARTGQERWVFQTTHHDIWDYDLPSKPVLYDVPNGAGGRLPALIQTTKRGEIFMLDRRTGRPIAEVQEKPVPSTGALPGERLSPTQPYSVGMPQIRQGVLSEARMWGVTPLDQLACRIAFKSLKYDGDFTPPSTDWYLPHPSPYGTLNWGGVSVDRVHDYLVLNDMRIMMKAKLIPRPGVQSALTASGKKAPSVAGVVPMEGTPFGAVRAMVTSPLGVPCTEPPFGTMTAIDLKTRKIAWQRSLGTPKQIGPLGHGLGLPIPIGMPSLGGPVATKSGLVFYTGTADYFLRAMDVRTGREIWKSPLPVAGQATPTVFVSPASGRQFVVVTAGGGRTAPDRGDYIIAYALPK
ncbi:MAG: quinate dehydrogenase [Caulobacterales bacterium 68-7]|nr:MAG: quinate dehydrogenase [Caulobacterales bacterium 68-7]